MGIEIHQALYGYSDGHSLLAASQQLEARATRELRTFTDLAFDGQSDSYLTCIPVDTLRQQALIRTWPAPESSRPGSVWSHVLFVNFIDLGGLESLRGLLSLFRRPEPGTDGKPAFRPYESSITMAALPRGSTNDEQLNLADNLLVLWASYGEQLQSVVRVKDPAKLETSLIAVWEQQWPRLRRSFSFRTRYRVSSQHGDAFDVQVVERLGRDQAGLELADPLPAWVNRLGRDLISPDDDLRRFLRRYGAESGDGRTDVRPLTEIQETLASGAVESVPQRVFAAFPRGEDMSALKRTLLGRADENGELWHLPEHERLLFALEADPPEAVDLTDLEVRSRLDVLWQEKPRQAARVVAAVYRDEERPVDALVIASTTQYAQGEQIAALAEPHPGLALAAMRERPDLLSAPELWTGSPAARELVADLLGQSDTRVREQVLLNLLSVNSVEAAYGVVEQEPSLWWTAMRFNAERVGTAPSELQQRADVLRRLLEVAGPAAIGSMPKALESTIVLKLLAVVFPPQAGLWRQASSQQWVNVAPDLVGIEADGPRLRALVVLLLATRLAGTAQARRQLWLAAFAPLHTALVNDELESPEWDALAALLPSGENWDRSDRLRRGAAKTIVRDKWPSRDAQAIVKGAHPYEDRVVAALQPKRKKSKGWLRDLLDHLVP